MLAVVSSCLVVGLLLSNVALLLMVVAPSLWLLHFRVDTRHAHAERLLAKAGVANGKVFERSFLGGPRFSVGEPKPGGRTALESAIGAEPLSERIWSLFPGARLSASSICGRWCRKGGASGSWNGRWTLRSLPAWS